MQRDSRARRDFKNLLLVWRTYDNVNEIRHFLKTNMAILFSLRCSLRAYIFCNNIQFGSDYNMLLNAAHAIKQHKTVHLIQRKVNKQLMLCGAWKFLGQQKNYHEQVQY